MNSEGSRHSLSASIAENINKMIIQDEMAPGARLPSESQLAERYLVSRSTIREAMKLLRAQNIVVIRQGDGTYVSARTGMSKDPLGFRFIKKEILTEGIFEARLLMEPQIAMLAAERATEGDLREMGENVRAFSQLGYRDTARFALDIQFHTLLAKCSKNPVFIQLMPAILQTLEKGSILPEESHLSAQRMHDEIYSAMMRRDVCKAKSATEVHIYNSFYDLQALEKEGWIDL